MCEESFIKLVWQIMCVRASDFVRWITLRGQITLRDLIRLTTCNTSSRSVCLGGQCACMRYGKPNGSLFACMVMLFEG